MQKFLLKTALLVALFLAVPAFTLAASAADNEGTLNIVLVDRFGEPALGDWYLHQTGPGGLTLRNGISSDSFDIKSGSYYLELRNTKDYKAYEIDIDPYQFLNPGETITFNVVYYPDDEAMALGPITPVDPEEDVVEEPTAEPVEEPAVEPATEPETTVTTEPETSGTYVPDFNEAPRPEVPTFEQAPEEPAVEIGAVTPEVATPPMLATTGIPAFLLLFPSMAGAYFITRRRQQI